MNTILIISAVAIIALSVLWNIVFKKNAVIRFVCVAARLVLAFIGTAIFKSQLVSRSSDIVTSVASLLNLEPSVTDSIMQSGELTSIAAALSAALVSVIVFFLLYFALALVMYIVRAILMAIIRPKGTHIGVRVALGVLQGFILITCLLIPVSTYAGMADAILPTVKEMAPETDVSVVEDPVNELNDSVVIKAHRALGGKFLSNSLTSMKLKLGDDVETTNLNSEIDNLVKLAADVSALTKVEMANYTEKETAILENLGSYATDSKLVGAILTNVIGDATDAWNNGQDYMGIEKPTLNNPTFDPLVNKVISIIATDSHNAAHLGEDINTVGKMVSKLAPVISQGTGEGESGGADISEVLMADGMIKDLLTIINENPRMRPLIPAVTNVGLTIAAQSLGINANAQEAYNQFTQTIANELKNNSSLPADERQENLEAIIADSLDSLGITDIEETEISIIAVSVIAYFDGDTTVLPENITANDVSDFLGEMTDAINSANLSNATVSASGSFGFSYLANQNRITGATAGNLIADICAIQNNQTLSQTEKEARIAALLSGSPIFNDNPAGLSNQKLSEMKTNILAKADRPTEKSTKALESVGGLVPTGENTAFKHTLDNILVSEEALNGEISKEEMDSVIDSISGVFTNIGDMMGSLDSEDKTASMAAICTTMGGILDSLSDSESFYGEEKTQLLLETVLNSSTVKDLTSLTTKDTQNIIDAKNDAELTYSELMNVVSETINIFIAIQNGQSITDETVEKLVDALAIKNCGAVISVILTPEKLDTFGLANTSPEKLESASKLLTSLFSNIAIENEEQRAAEVEAFKHLITIATANTSSEAEGMLGENGAFGTDAEEIVDTILGSAAMKKALSTTDMAKNPFNITVSASDEHEFASAINSRLVGADAETATALRALANLFGINL